MKSSILYFGIIAYMLFSGCESESDPLIPEIRHIAGTAAVVGNEPFTYPAIIIGSSVYILDCNKELEKLICLNQGKQILVYYTEKYQNAQSMWSLKVIAVELIKCI